MEPKVAAVLVAAGQGSRMGGGKLLLPLGEHTLVECAVRTFLGASVSELVIVVGAYALAVQRALRDYPVRFAFNPDPAAEMIDSVRCGLRALSSDTLTAFLIAPADMPLILPETVHHLVAALLSSDRLIAVPTFRRRHGHPVAFRAAMYETVLHFRSPQGLRPLVHGAQFRPLTVPVDDEGVVTDVDSWDDYRHLLRLWQARRQQQANLPAKF
ncbi:Nicotine blue oxidoreductase [bacterium HR17]|uniref:Nicotine blue oxidoreductase n=1 Tax=Candidatus Fervidibacter japonicus TaxID=2035412 RepID=A0A2H5XBA6_9BACT|nr:Nicotine blue oxidoreductase [bacterium HR17]